MKRMGERKNLSKSDTCFDLGQLEAQAIAQMSGLTLDDSKEDSASLPHSHSTPQFFQSQPLLPELPEEARKDIDTMKQIFSQTLQENRAERLNELGPQPSLSGSFFNPWSGSFSFSDTPLESAPQQGTGLTTSSVLQSLK